MLDRNMYDLVCSSAADLGEPQMQRLRKNVASSLGATIGDMFPGFASAFPATVAIIERDYSVPVVLFQKHGSSWLPFLASEGGRANIFFALTSLALETEGVEFENYCGMLPRRWKELYRYFWSFEVTERSTKSIDWTNTPFSYSGRLAIERYRALRGVKKATIRDFVRATDAGSSYSLYCWLLTDSGDALFLDEGKRDHKVYHVKNDDFSDYYLINDPETVLDEYLAHYLKTQSPEGFDFRILY